MLQLDPKGMRDVDALHDAWTVGLNRAGFEVIPQKDYRHDDYPAEFADLAAADAIVVFAAYFTDMPGMGEAMSAVASQDLLTGDFGSWNPRPVFVQFLDGDEPRWWTNMIGDHGSYQRLSPDLDTAVAEVVIALDGR
jgi:hypothetical protein